VGDSRQLLSEELLYLSDMPNSLRLIERPAIRVEHPVVGRADPTPTVLAGPAVLGPGDLIRGVVLQRFGRLAAG